MVLNARSTEDGADDSAVVPHCDPSPLLSLDLSCCKSAVPSLLPRLALVSPRGREREEPPQQRDSKAI